MDSIHDAFVEGVVAKMKTLKVGHALDEGIFMGPVVDDKQLASNMAGSKKPSNLVPI